MSRKPISTKIYHNPQAFTTATAFSTTIGPIAIDDFDSWRASIVSSATGAINMNIQVAPMDSQSDTNLDLWSDLPTTTVDYISTVAACATDFPACAVEKNTYSYLRVQCRISATQVTAALGSFRLVITGERK